MFVDSHDVSCKYCRGLNTIRSTVVANRQVHAVHLIHMPVVITDDYSMQVLDLKHYECTACGRSERDVLNIAEAVEKDNPTPTAPATPAPATTDGFDDLLRQFDR